MLVLQFFIFFVCVDYCTLDDVTRIVPLNGSVLVHQSALNSSSSRVSAESILSIHDMFRRNDGNDIMKDLFNIGPKRTKYYNPNYGYEPYWVGGDWVFDRLQITTVKPTNTVCGDPCPEMYVVFGKICARNYKFQRKQFKNYCELLDIDCRGGQKWMILYRGDCRDLVTYPTGYTKIITRAYTYESRFNSIQSQKTTKFSFPPGFNMKSTTKKN